MKVYLNKSVLQAAKERVKFIFDEFENVIVNVSGGKDSTVVLDLALKEAKKRGRLPMNVFFIDQEAEWPSTIEWMRRVMYDKHVNPLWLQVEFRLINATTYKEDRYLWCWKKGEEWLREKEEIAIKENVFGVIDFYDLFNAAYNYFFKNLKTAIIYGVRAEENPRRLLAMTVGLTYKNVTWGRKNKNPLHYNFSPIYDWSYTDVWKYIHENELYYNKIYDYQYAAKVPIPNMRVSSLIHETALRNLTYLPRADLEFYNKMLKRIGGVHSYIHTYHYKLTLPPMFKDWREYRDYLLEKLIPKDRQKVFKKWFKRMDLEFADHPKLENILKSQCIAVIKNDWDGGTILKNIYKEYETPETIKKYWRRLKHVKRRDNQGV